MATSGTINFTSSYANMKMRLQWSSTTTVSTFKTTVSYTLQASQTESSSTYYATYSGPLTFSNGSSTVASKTVSTSTVQVGSSWVTIATGSFTVTHSSNGNAPTISVSGTVTDNHRVSYTASGSISLNRITTKATITSAPNFADSDNPTVYYSNPIGSNATALEISIYDTTGYTPYAGYRSVSKTGSSYTFNLTTAERNALIAAAGNSTTLQVTFYLRTTIGSSTYLSSSTKTFTIDASGPTITASISDVKAVTKALTGGGTKFIRGNNSMQFSMTATGQKGATISSYSVVCGNMKSSSASGTFTNIENDVVIFSATDNRGKTSTKTVQLTAIDYVKLTCNQEVRMIMESENSAQIHLEITGNFFNGSFGAKSNTLKLYVRHARNGESFGDWVDLSALLYETNGNTYSLSPDISGFDPSGTYLFQCRAVDALSDVSTGTYAVKFYPVFDWSQDDFNFNVPVQMNGQTILRHNATANNLVVSASGGFIYFRPGGTSSTSGEVKINPQGSIELSGDIIINGKSLKSLLGIS